MRHIHILSTWNGSPALPKRHTQPDAYKRALIVKGVDKETLTAETVIGALEDAEDYRGFEGTITADYDAQSAVERELSPPIGQPVSPRDQSGQYEKGGKP